MYTTRTPDMRPAPAPPLCPLPDPPRGTSSSSRGGGTTKRTATTTATHDAPRSEEDITQYVLFDGLPLAGPSLRNARERQTQAYLHFTHRIRERVEAAHAVVLSANPLSLAVMASQLRMYRWRVTEAQTLLETTSVLQDLVMDVAKHGYRVRRRPAAPRGVSRYANGRGAQALKKIAQGEREKLEADTAGGLRSVSTASSSQPTRPRADVNGLAADGTTGAAAAAAAPVSGVEEEDEEAEESTLGEREEDRLPLPPPDALPRLVLVDGFTHEEFAEIARHVRFVDNENGLELLLVLLLPTDSQAAAVATQGAGVVVTPAHEASVADAYEAGYDLVLAHNMDNLLVDFLTSAFVSSVGRWRNDVRSKAAVGNYMSVRNVLLGGLDTASLQRLVWDDNTDDAEVLELLGAQSLSTQGGAKRFGEASRQLLGQQQQQQLEQQRARANDGGSSDEDVEGGNSSIGGGGGGGARNKMKRVASNMLGNVSRLRSRPTSVAHFGVRLPADQRNAHAPMSTFGRTRDVLGGVMSPADHGPRGGGGGGRRRRNRQNGGSGGPSGSDYEDEDGEYYGDGVDEDQRMLQGAMEREMGRLMAENDGKQASLDAMQKEVESLHRTVRILKRHVPGGGSMNPDLDSSVSRTVDRPDSGSMVHLAKQQQIYILKERLEAANDHIVALLRDGRGNENPAASGRGRPGAGGNSTNDRTARARGGGNTGSVGAGGGGGFPAAAARRAAAGAYSQSFSPNVYRRRAYEAYHAAREGEMMTLLDEDAHYVNATLAQIPQQAAGSESRGANRVSSAMLQRKEREATDQVIHAMQEELRFLQGRLDSQDGPPGSLLSGGSGGGDLQSRMATHLQAAVERLEAQRQRVRHLEELRQTDQLLLAHAVRLNEHVKRELSAARRAGDGDSNGSGDEGHDDDEGNANAAGKRGRRTAKGGTKARGKKAGSGGEDASTTAEKGRKKGTAAAGGNALKAAGGNANANTSRSTSAGTTRSGGAAGGAAAAAAAGAATSSGKSKGRREAANANLLDPTEVEDLIAAAVTDAVAARNRIFQRQLGALVQTCRTQLTRVMLKHQKPRTIAYVQMLQEELQQARRDQRAAVMRLQFTLSHLRPDQYDAASVPPQTENSRSSKSRSHSRARSSGGGGADGNDPINEETGEGEESGPMIPLRAVTDADVRRAAERVAREHAAYAMRAAYMTAELQRVQRAQESGASAAGTPSSSQRGGGGSRVQSAGGGGVGASAASISATAAPSVAPTEKTFPPSRPASSSVATPASPDQLLRAYQQATEHVKQAVEAVSPVQTYLDAVQAELEAEQRLSPWCDVDYMRLFQALPTPSSNMAIAPAPHLALMPTNLHHDFPSASEFTLQSLEDGEPLYLPDLDGSVRDVADVYGTLLRSFVSLGEGWGNALRFDELTSAAMTVTGSGGSGSGGGKAAARVSPVASAAASEGVKGGRTSNARHGRPETSLETADDDKDDGGAATLAAGGGDTKAHKQQGRRRRQQQQQQKLSLALPEPLTFHQALAMLPLGPPNVSQYQGRLTYLYSAEPPYSPAQRRLYEILLQAYQQRCIHPLHMAGLEATVLTANDATGGAATFSLLEAAYAQHREVVGLLQITAPLATPALCSLVQQVQQAQHLLEREASGGYGAGRAAARCTSASFLAAVDSALLGCVVDELRWRRWQHTVAAAAASITQGASANSPTSPTSTQRQQDEDVRNARLLEALVAARATATGAPPSTSSASPLVDVGTQQEDATDPRVLDHYAMFCGARVGIVHPGSSQALDVALLSRADLSGHHPEDLFNFSNLSAPPAAATSPASSEAYRRLASLLPRLSGSTSEADASGQMVARELAHFFGRRRAKMSGTEDDAEAAEAAEAALLRDIYLDDGTEGGGGGDANMQAIRRLRMELEYMETLRRQRMEELATRCDWRLQGRSGDLHLSSDDGFESGYHSGQGSRGGSGGAGGGGNGNGGNGAYPAIDPERLNFAVKSGTSAWYGMEAAKRVRAILRRRARPDQIIVGGGPDGGGVGIELSRRTAQPAVPPPLRTAAPQSAAAAATAAAAAAAVARTTHGGAATATASATVEDENGYEVEDIRDFRAPRYERRAAPSQLPSVASSSFYQPHRGQATAAPSSVTHLPPLRPPGVSRAQYAQDGRTRPTFMEQVESRNVNDDGTPRPQPYVSPRDAVSLSAYANLAGSYDDGFSTGSVEDLGSRIMAYRAELTRAAGRLSPSSTATYANGAPYCLPMATPPATHAQGENALARTTPGARPRAPLPLQTSWVYGVPTTNASSLVQQQSTIDPNQPRDTLLFMPPRTRSSIAETAERNTQHQRRFSARFLAGAAASSLPYATPAAMAAQRLQSMLTASMVDPSVMGLTSAAALRQHQQATTAAAAAAQRGGSYAPPQQHPEGSSSAPPTPRAAAGGSSSMRSASARELHGHEWGEEDDASVAAAAAGGGARPERSMSVASETEQPVELDTTIGPGVRKVPYADDSDE